MPEGLNNISYDATPVIFRLDSPLVVCFDPIALDFVRGQLASLPANARTDAGEVLQCLNENNAAISCYLIPNFQPGIFSLDPCDILKFGSEDDEGYDEDIESAVRAESYRYVGVDSAALVFVDFDHIARLVELLNCDQYELALRGEPVFDRITEALGGPYFAVVLGGSRRGVEFDGDGTYTIKAGGIRPCVAGDQKID
jgi:hypothetical protein